MFPFTPCSLPALILLSSPPVPLPCHHFPHFCPLLAAPCLSLLLSLFSTLVCLLQLPFSLLFQSDEREEEEERCGEKGEGGDLKWSGEGDFFFPLSFFKILPVWEEQTRAPRPLGSSLVCTGCRSGDMATGFHPNCRNISSTVESGIAGKDNENWTEWRKGEDEGGGMGHGLVYTAVIQIQLL